jgi:hypothetical protein
VVDTGITTDDNANSVPITSTMGYFRLKPKYIDIHADAYKSKIDPRYPNTNIIVNFTITDHLMRAEEILMTATPPFSPLPPIVSHNLRMTYGLVECTWHIDDWVDQNETGKLDRCDRILLSRIASNTYGTPPPGPPLWFHVREVGLDGFGWVVYVKLGQIVEADKYVYLDGNLIAGPIHEYEKPCIPIVEEISLPLDKCKHTIKVVKVITTRWWLCKDNAYQPIDYTTIGANANFEMIYELPVWITIPEDITGSYYINTQLPAPDCKVDLKDVFAAGKAFGSIPGDAKWNTVADINHDYKTDLKDYFAIAKKFGKW